MIRMKRLYEESEGYFLWTRILYRFIIASFVIALFGNIGFFLPHTCVPFYFQNIAIFFSALVLGKREALCSVFLFLYLKFLGVPVYAGLTGPWAFWGPTGGFLLAYLPCVYLIGELREKYRGIFQVFCILCLANFLHHLCGWSWLSFFLGPKNAFLYGTCPFVFVDLTKTFLACSLYRLYLFFLSR